MAKSIEIAALIWLNNNKLDSTPCNGIPQKHQSHTESKVTGFCNPIVGY